MPISRIDLISSQLGSATTVAEVQAMNEAGQLPKKLISPSYRDTVQIPDGGYSIFRFKADNPGKTHIFVEFI